MGRAPCCDKVGLKKGPWTPEEDRILVSFIHQYGHSNWRALPKQAGLLRCGKSCRLRWMNYLRPDIKRGNFTKEEEDTIIQLHEIMGNRWSAMAARLPGRTDNEIKNIWHTHLKKKLKQCQTTKPKPEMAATTHRNHSHTNKNFVTTISNETTSAASYQIVPTSQQSYSTSDDFSSFTEVSSLQDSNNARVHTNTKNEQIFGTPRQNGMDYFPIIDDTFWSHDDFHNNGSLNMAASTFPKNNNGSQWQSQFSNENASKTGNSLGPENYGDNMDFWCDIFLTTSSALEF